ncbi:MAG: hypothetical protein AB7P01_19330 [Bacteroidia bacterium]
MKTTALPMKTNKRKLLQQKLFAAIITVMKDNDAMFTFKTKRAINKTLKRIAKKTLEEKVISSKK